jgi:rod shape-determining protein MreD
MTLDFVAVDNVHTIFFLVPLFYWVIHRPAVMPLWFVFIGGLYVDFSVDGLLGLHAFSFLAYYLFLYRVRRIILSQPLLYQYCVFGLGAVGFEILRWCMVSLLTWEIWAFLPSLAAFVINIVAFPVIILVLKALHRIMSIHGRR